MTLQMTPRLLLSIHNHAQQTNGAAHCHRPRRGCRQSVRHRIGIYLPMPDRHRGWRGTNTTLCGHHWGRRHLLSPVHRSVPTKLDVDLSRHLRRLLDRCADPGQLQRHVRSAANRQSPRHRHDDGVPSGQWMDCLWLVWPPVLHVLSRRAVRPHPATSPGTSRAASSTRVRFLAARIHREHCTTVRILHELQLVSGEDSHLWHYLHHCVQQQGRNNHMQRVGRTDRGQCHSNGRRRSEQLCNPHL